MSSAQSTLTTPLPQTTNAAEAKPRKGRLLVGILIGAVFASAAWFALIRIAASASFNGPAPVSVAFPTDNAFIPDGGHFVEVTNRSSGEITVSPSLLISRENLWLKAPKIALDPGETRRIQFWRKDRVPSQFSDSHVQWAMGGDTIKIDAHGFARRFEPAEARVP